MSGRAARRRNYTNEDRINAVLAVKANGGRIKPVADALGIPRPTLITWVKGQSHPEVAKEAEKPERRLPLADEFENIAYRCLGGLTDEKIEAMNGVDLLKTAGISVDKMRLLREQPTVITQNEYKNLSEDELSRRIKETEDAIATLERGETVAIAERPMAAIAGAADAGTEQSG